jgi:dihydrofolate synthase/folylpolyglutamate synthase
MKLGLENISKLLQRLGDPQDSYPSILVAGTNGKGSVCAYVTSILMASGLKVGTFFSPHLFRVNERIRLNMEEITTSDLDGLLGTLRAERKRIPFTYFEGITAAAALYFEHEGVDLAVFEVGLGGRLDATRLVNAAVTVITGISIDHHEHLGRTVKEILGEKLGIVRGGVPLVANLEKRSLDTKARRYCGEEEVPYHNAAQEVRVEGFRMEPGRLQVDMVSPERRYTGIVSRMIGRSQVRNIATAIRTVEVLAGSGAGGLGGSSKPNGSGKTRAAVKSRSCGGRAVPGRFALKAVRAGIGSALLAGRFQVLPGNPRIILDVSHNEESLLSSIETLLSISPRDRNVIVFGVQVHKELGDFPRRAMGAARAIFVGTLDSERGARGEDLLGVFDRARARGRAALEAAPSIGEAVRKAREILVSGDSLLILGSHLTVEKAVENL